MAGIKKTQEGTPGALLTGRYIGAATTENSMEVPQKVKKRISHVIQQAYFWVLTQKK